MGRIGREVEAATEAGESEEDPEPAPEIGAENVKRHREQRHPGWREKRKDALDAGRDQGAASRDDPLVALLDMEVVYVLRVGDDQLRAGGKSRPVGVDDVLVGQHRVDDERKAYRQQRDLASPSPSLVHQTSIDMPSRAARTSVPVRWARPAAISSGFARHTAMP